MTYDNISSQYQKLPAHCLIVVHCSATRADRSFPVEALRRCHVQERGFADIGYHFYITRDGITHVCRPIDHIAPMPAVSTTTASECVTKAVWTNRDNLPTHGPWNRKSR